MENTQMLLLAELPGLEAAKIAIDARIDEIRVLLTAGGAELIGPGRPAAILDPSILGRDVLGRLKRKRKLSPELIAQKRILMAAARQKRLDDLAGKVEAPPPPPAPPAPPEPQPEPIQAPHGKKKKALHG